MGSAASPLLRGRYRRVKAWLVAEGVMVRRLRDLEVKWSEGMGPPEVRSSRRWCTSWDLEVRLSRLNIVLIVIIFAVSSRWRPRLTETFHSLYFGDLFIFFR